MTTPETTPGTSAGTAAAAPVLDDLDDAHRTFLGLLMGLSDDAFAQPSLLPGWSRAHVVAHVANHGLALRRCVDAHQDGRAVPMYASVEARDDGIEAGSRRTPAQLREDSEFAAREATGALSTIRPDQSAETVERTPGGPLLELGELVAMRWREVLIHLADLDVGHGPTDWPERFVDHLLPVVAADRDGTVRREGGTAAVDLPDGASASGSPVDLVWWLLGRGDGSGLDGDLPELGPWLRRRR